MIDTQVGVTRYVVYTVYPPQVQIHSRYTARYTAACSKLVTAVTVAVTALKCGRGARVMKRVMILVMSVIGMWLRGLS